MVTKKQVLERWFWDYAGAFKARELFRAYSPPEGSTYTGIEMGSRSSFQPVLMAIMSARQRNGELLRQRAGGREDSQQGMRFNQSRRFRADSQLLVSTVERALEKTAAHPMPATVAVGFDHLSTLALNWIEQVKLYMAAKDLCSQFTTPGAADG